MDIKQVVAEHNDYIPREEVRVFSRVMEAKLRANDYKRHWREYSLEYLLTRLEEEVRELRSAITSQDGDVTGEAADVANFAMMIVDVAACRGEGEQDGGQEGDEI